MFYKQNTEALSHFPFQQGLLSVLQATLPSIDWTITATPQDDYTLVSPEGACLHHPQGATHEATQCVAEQCLPSKDNLHVIFGLGLGYLLEAVFEASEGIIIVYEPDVSLLRFVLENVDLSRFFDSRRVFLATTTFELIDVMPAFFTLGSNINTLLLPGEALRLGEDVPRLLSLIQHRVGDFTNSVKVSFAYNLKWYRHWPQCLPFTGLLDQFTDKPALIISSGPSLDDALETLRGVADKYTVFAVAGALRPLLAAGITPNYAIFLDYEGHRQQLHGIHPSQTKAIEFILGPYADSVVFEYEAAARWWVPLSNYPNFSEWLENVLQGQALAQPSDDKQPIWADDDTRQSVTHNQARKRRIQSGSSCSLMALNCALAMGCNPLVVLGQDLAFRGSQQYATGGAVSAQQLTFNEASQEFELPNSESFYGRKILWTTVPGQQGELLRTAPDYKIFLRQLAEFSRLNNSLPSPRRLYNASVGGALLDGFTHLSLAQVTQHEALEGNTENYKPVPIPTISADVATQASIQRLDCFVGVLRSCIQSGRLAVSQLDTFLEGVATNQSAWTLLQSLPLLETARGSLIQKLRSDPFMAAAMNGEIWYWQEAVNQQEKALDKPDPEASVTLQELYQYLETEKLMLHKVVSILSDSLMPWALTAVQALRIKSHNGLVTLALAT
jgi:hypothetical protein